MSRSLLNPLGNVSTISCKKVCSGVELNSPDWNISPFAIPYFQYT